MSADGMNPYSFGRKCLRKFTEIVGLPDSEFSISIYGTPGEDMWIVTVATGWTQEPVKWQNFCNERGLSVTEIFEFQPLPPEMIEACNERRQDIATGKAVQP